MCFLTSVTTEKTNNWWIIMSTPAVVLSICYYQKQIFYNLDVYTIIAMKNSIYMFEYRLCSKTVLQENSSCLFTYNGET